MRSLDSYSKKHFAIVRILLGAYVCYMTLLELPNRYSYYGDAGVLPIRSLEGFMPTWMYNFYFWFWNDSVMNAMYGIRLALGLAILTGLKRRWAGLMLWVVHILFLNRNVSTTTPEVSYVNWLLLALAVVPSGEGWSLTDSNKSWFMPKILFFGGWVIIATSYFYAGIRKLENPHWLNGQAMSDFILNHAAARTIYTEYIQHVPLWISALLTYYGLIVEIMAPFVLFSRGGRKLWWGLSLSMHFGAMALFNIAQIGMAMLLFHLFILEEEWIRPWRR